MTVTVLIVILAILAALLALVSFVLISPLSVRLVYKETLEVFAGLSFIKFKVFPKEKKEKKNKNKGKKKKIKVTKTKASPAEMKKTGQEEHISSSEKSTQKSAKKDVAETLKLVFEIIKSVFDVMGKRATIKIDELHVVVSKEDAADTAVYFGICGGIVSNILAFTSNFGKAVINDKNILVEPDFVSGKSSLSTDITLSVQTGSLVVGLVKGYLKGISKK